MSNQKFLTMNDLNLIIPDRQTYGIGFSVTNWAKLKQSLEYYDKKNHYFYLTINGKQYKLNVNEKVNGIDNKGDQSLGQSRIIYYFENSLNGQRLVREHVNNKFTELNSSKLLSSNLDDNFQPISDRLNPKIKYQTIIKYTLSCIIKYNLEKTRSVLLNEFNKRWPNQVNELHYFTLNSIDLNVDMISEGGIDYGTHSEIANRLSRVAINQDRGKYIDYDSGRNYPEVFSAVNSSIESGIPCFKGTLNNDSEILTYFKAKQVINNTIYYLNRIEWKITTSLKSSGTEKLTGILGDQKSNRFENSDQLETILDKLYLTYRNLLTPLFNMQFRMTDTDIINTVSRIIEDISPRNSYSLINTLTKPPFRISVSIAQALGVYNTLKSNCNKDGTGIFYKPEGSHGHDYMFNWPNYKKGSFSHIPNSNNNPV